MNKAGEMQVGDIIEVTWIDAWSNSHGYGEPDHTYEPLPCVDVGYFLQENDHGVTTVRSMAFGGVSTSFRGESFTPWEMIIDIEVLVG